MHWDSRSCFIGVVDLSSPRKIFFGRTLSGITRRVSMNFIQQFRVAPGTRLKLKDIDPGLKDVDESRRNISQFW